MHISLLRTFHMEDSQAVNISEPCLFVNNRETPPQPTSRKATEDLERLTCQNGSFGRNSSLLAVAAQQTYTPWVGTSRVSVVRSSSSPSVIMLSPIVTIFDTGKLLRRGMVKLVDRRMTHSPTPRPPLPNQVANFTQPMACAFAQCTGLGLKASARLCECCRQARAGVVSNSTNKIHQTWPKPFSRALYV